MYDLRITIYELRFTIWIFARLRAEKRSEGAAEFLKQGELLARKLTELRHAVFPATSFIQRKRTGTGLNEHGENFIGTDVPHTLRASLDALASKS